jgi:hypothetical protein
MYYFWFYDAVLWTVCLNILLDNFINRMSKLLFRLGGFEITTLVVIGTKCTDSCKSNYHMITTAPQLAFGTVQRVWCLYDLCHVLFLVL